MEQSEYLVRQELAVQHIAWPTFHFLTQALCLVFVSGIGDSCGVITECPTSRLMYNTEGQENSIQSFLGSSHLTLALFIWACEPHDLKAVVYSPSGVQEVITNSRPASLEIGIEGIDITLNGQLNGRPVEPPNPAICVSNDTVLEVTNNVRTALNSKHDFNHLRCRRGLYFVLSSIAMQCSLSCYIPC